MDSPTVPLSAAPNACHAGGACGGWTSRIPFWTALGLFLLRIAFLGRTDLFPEEAYYWNYAKHLDIGYLDHPPMVAWLIHLGTLLFGDQEIGVRIFAVVCTLLTSFFTFRLTSLLFDRRVGQTALLLVAVLPFFFMTGFMMTPDAPLTAAWAGALYFLARVFFKGEAGAWFGLGACLGLGMLSKYTIALLGPATLLFLILDPPSRRWWRHPAPYAAVAFSVLIFSPVIVWNFLHDWASFAFQSSDRIAEHRRFSTHELLGAILALVTPVGVWLAIRGLAVPLIDNPEESRKKRFALVYTAVPLSVFVLFSLTHRVKLNWTGPLWLALIPVLAVSVVGLREDSAPRALRWLWQATVGILLAIYLCFFQYTTGGLPGVPYAKNMALLPVGWSELGRVLERERAAVPQANHRPVLLVGLDRNFVASAGAFYHSHPVEAVRETTGVHLFDGHSLMYEYWFPVQLQTGSNLLVASFEVQDLKRQSIAERCAQLGPIKETWLERSGKRIRPIYTRVVEGYSPKRDDR